MASEPTYAKGQKPRDLDGAKGGLVLERTQSWQKDPDPDYHPMGSGMLGPFNTQNYAKPASGTDGDERRKGDTKSMPPVKPRK